MLEDDRVADRAAEVHAEVRVDHVPEGDGVGQVVHVEPHATDDAVPVVACPVGAVAERAQEPDRVAGHTVNED